MKQVLLVMIILMLMGCKRDSSFNRVRTVTSSSSSNSGTTTVTLTYDSQGRLWSERDSLNKFVYVYSPNQITETSYDQFDSILGVSIYYLNEKGLVLGVGPRNTSYYDSLGEEILEISGQDTFKYIWSNGDKITQTSIYGTLISVDTLSYLPRIDNRDFGQSCFGKSSSHLLSSVNEGGVITNYTYTFDSKERVNSELSTSGSTYSTYQYTYY